MKPDRRTDALEAADPVNPPVRRAMAPVGKQTAVLVAAGTGVGAALAGAPGALVGGAVGFTVDAVRRRLAR